MSLFTLRVHVARFVTDLVAHQVLPPEQPVHLLVLLDLTRPLTQQWSATLDCRYACHWRDSTDLCTPTALLLLSLGYLGLCLPCAALAVFIFIYSSPYPPSTAVLLYAGLIFLLSLLLFRAYAYALYTHRFFSTLQNKVAFNVHTPSVSFFKQYAAFTMKPYAARVPLVTITRAFVNHITLTTLSYHLLPHQSHLLLPTACEAIDTLRAKKTSSLFINLIIITPAHDNTLASMQTLHAFFLASGLQAFLTSDLLLVCAWGSVPATTYEAPLLLPLLFEFPHDICNQEDEQQHDDFTELRLPKRRAPRASWVRRMAYRLRNRYYYRELASPDHSFIML